MERILSLLGLAHKAGRVEIGEEPVGSAARAKKARIILVAGDAAASSVRRAMGFANTGSCLCLVIPTTKEQLGRALGRTSCAMAAVTDIGFADAVTGKLAALDPEKFQSAAQRMTVKAQRARERRQEQLAHEKNVRMGKKHHNVQFFDVIAAQIVIVMDIGVNLIAIQILGEVDDLLQAAAMVSN